MSEIEKWRAAYTQIYVPDAGLQTMAPFPSLYAGDFITYLEGKGIDPSVASFVRGITREMQWAYDGWAKAQRDGDPAKLIASMIGQASGGPEYEFTRRFLLDYAKANGIATPDINAEPPWKTAVGDVMSAPAPLPEAA